MEDSLVRAFGGLSLQQRRAQDRRPPRRRRFSKSLYLLRGLPGSGKSTLARYPVSRAQTSKPTRNINLAPAIAATRTRYLRQVVFHICRGHADKKRCLWQWQLIRSKLFFCEVAVFLFWQGFCAFSRAKQMEAYQVCHYPAWRCRAGNNCISCSCLCHIAPSGTTEERKGN
ncbi:NEDD4-binding protein 2-like 1 isoform X2 [Varanus komodoensis]|uniref:NEDD4-binding protein 2-like 1 isoform X2 n=1 Tax=Varanus komodoensis TaxID=61221 RepID=UPI001CF7B871|nr:NEDD4-binding protein 2-like 1 isoform X2 [Varanus komodoensis]